MVTSHQRVLVLCPTRDVDPVLEQAVRSEGYEMACASTLEELAAADEAKGCAALVLLEDPGTELELTEALERAEEKLSPAKFMVFAANGTKEPPELAERLGADRLLWMPREEVGPENASRIREFLQGEGYRWASDVSSERATGPSLLHSRRTHVRRREAASKLHAFVRELSDLEDLGQMLEAALRRYLELLDCDAGSIYLWDERTETLILKAAEGPETEKRVGLRQKMGEGLAGWVAQVREPILVSDTRKVHKLQGRDFTRYPDFSCVAAPICHGGQLFGVVCLTMPRGERRFEPDELHLVQALSQKLGSLIRPLSFLNELHSFNRRLLDVLKSCSDLVVEKDTQVESLRALSSNILDSIPIAVVAYDARLRVRSANTAAQELFGYDPAEDGARVPLRDGLEVDPELWEQKLRATVEEGNEFRLQRVRYAREQGERMLDVRCSPLHDSGEGTVGGILTVQDVTTDVEMEAKLSSAQRLALMGKLAAKVAHELNNPLDGIMRFMNLATRKMEDDPEGAQKHLEQCEQGLKRMGNILTQLLAFSRGHEAASRPMSLSQVVRDAVGLYEQRAEEAGTEIRLDIPPDLPRCESPELCDVFGNLVKNSLDALEGGGTIEIAGRREDDEVCFTFADDGPGVPERIRDKIFQPFFTTKKSGAGTGLGLAACRDSLNRMGGAIELVPSEQGAVFEISVPVDDEQ